MIGNEENDGPLPSVEELLHKPQHTATTVKHRTGGGTDRAVKHPTLDGCNDAPIPGAEQCEDGGGKADGLQQHSPRRQWLDIRQARRATGPLQHLVKYFAKSKSRVRFLKTLRKTEDGDKRE